MKKVFMYFLLIGLFSCSKSDPAPTPAATSNDKYNITIMQSCPTGTQIAYCVTKAAYDAVKNRPFTGQPCEVVSFQTISDGPRSGYLASLGTGCN
jgi:hypothetical protein